MIKTQEQLISSIEQLLENLMTIDGDLAYEYECELYYDCNDDEEPVPIVENFTPELLAELEKVVYESDTVTKLKTYDQGLSDCWNYNQQQEKSDD